MSTTLAFLARLIRVEIRLFSAIASGSPLQQVAGDRGGTNICSNQQVCGLSSMLPGIAQALWTSPKVMSL